MRAPAQDLDAGNSGSTIRMLSGILAGQPFASRIFGDESLSRRPMQRVMKPLAQMGARIEAREDQFPPLDIEGAPLRAIDYTLPVPSAQVRLRAIRRAVRRRADERDGAGAVARPHRNRAARIRRGYHGGARSRSRWGRPVLTGRELVVPSDLSSAAFFLVAALLVPGSRLSISGVGLNPTRSALLDFLVGMGARIGVPALESHNGERLSRQNARQHADSGTGITHVEILRRGAQPVEAFPVNGKLRSGTLDADSQRAHASQSGVAIGAGGIIRDPRIALGDGRNHGVAMRNGFIAGQRNAAGNGRGRRNSFGGLQLLLKHRPAANSRWVSFPCGPLPAHQIVALLALHPESKLLLHGIDERRGGPGGSGVFVPVQETTRSYLPLSPVASVTGDCNWTDNCCTNHSRPSPANCILPWLLASAMLVLPASRIGNPSASFFNFMGASSESGRCGGVPDLNFGPFLPTESSYTIPDLFSR